MKYATDAMKESRIPDFLSSVKLPCSVYIDISLSLLHVLDISLSMTAEFITI